MRVSTESNDLNSTRVGFSSSVDHARTADVASSSKPPFKPTFKKILNAFVFAARVSRVRPVVDGVAREATSAVSRPHAAAERPSRNERISKGRPSPWVISSFVNRQWI